MEKIHVLLIDDEENLLSATKLYLEKMNNNLLITTTNSAEAAFSKFKSEHFDVVISDYQLNEQNGLELLRKVRAITPNIPFIIFTGKGREEVVIEALNLGADYYLQKGGDPKSQFRELLNLIEKSFEQKKSEITLRKSEEKFYKAFKYSLNSIILLRINDRQFLDVNNNFIELLKYDRSEIVGKPLKDLPIFARPEDYSMFEKILIEKSEIFDFETLLLGKDARIIPVQISATVIDIDGAMSILANVRDISELSQMVETLKENEQKYRFLFNESPVAILRLNLFDLKTQFDSLDVEELNSIIASLENNALDITNYFLKVKISELNNVAKRLFGLELNEEISTEKTNLLLEKNVDFCKKVLLAFLKENSDLEIEATILNLKNEHLEVIARLTIAQDSKDNWSKILLTIVDITDISKIKSTLKHERKIFQLIANASLQCGSINEYCQTILMELATNLNFEYGSIRIISEDEGLLDPIATFGLNENQLPLIKPIPITEDNSRLIQDLKGKKITILKDLKSSDYFKNSTFLQELEMQTYVFCPLLGLNEKHLGSIILSSKFDRIILEEDKEFLNAIAKIVSTIIQKYRE